MGLSLRLICARNLGSRAGLVAEGTSGSRQGVERPMARHALLTLATIGLSTFALSACSTDRTSDSGNYSTNQSTSAATSDGKTDSSDVPMNGVSGARAGSASSGVYGAGGSGSGAVGDDPRSGPLQLFGKRLMIVSRWTSADSRMPKPSSTVSIAVPP